MDLRLNFKTRNILCQPVRSFRGGGNVIGVIQMINKIGADSFDESDEEALSHCVQRVADHLNNQFAEILAFTEKFSGNAVFIGDKHGQTGASKHTYNAPTKASLLNVKSHESIDSAEGNGLANILLPGLAAEGSTSSVNSLGSLNSTGGNRRRKSIGGKEHKQYGNLPTI